MSTDKAKSTCERCTGAEATVWFSVVTGKGKVSRRQYCRKCAEEERLKLIPIAKPEPGDTQVQQAPQSLMDIVSKELEHGKKSSPIPSAVTIKKLKSEMEKAIAEENYEKAAQIRDAIAKMNG